jgi:hypothetical protein
MTRLPPNSFRRELPTRSVWAATVDAIARYISNVNIRSELKMTIRKVKSGYRLVSKKGKNLGTYKSKAGAEKRERQVQYFKKKKA